MEEATSVGATITRVVITMTDTIMVGNITTEDARNITEIKPSSIQVIRDITRTIMAEARAVTMTGTDSPEIIAL